MGNKMWLSTIIVYIGGYSFLLFIALCLATGLYYLAELIEEYSRLTRRIVSYAIRAIILLHVLVLIVDRLPWTCVGVGLAAHISYLRLLKQFPYLDLISMDFFMSFALSIANNVLWIRFFITHPSTVHVTVEFLIGFFIVMVWVIPFAFFMSLAATDGSLPTQNYPSQPAPLSPSPPQLPGGEGLVARGGGGREVATSAGEGNVTATGKKSRSVFLAIMNFAKDKRDQWFPRLADTLPGEYRPAWEKSL